MSLKTLSQAQSANPRCNQILGKTAAELAVTFTEAAAVKKIKKGGTELRLLMIGLDGAGKTVIFNKIEGNAHANVAATTSTIGFNVTTNAIPYLNFSGDSLSMWDMGGLAVLRKKWKEYYSGVDGIVFVIDAAKRDRFEEVKKELSIIVNDVPELSHAPLLILANKQDVEGAATVAEIESLIVAPVGLPSSPRPYIIQGSIATAPTADGVREGLSWIHNVLKVKGAGLRKGGLLSKGPVLAGIVASIAVLVAVTAMNTLHKTN